LTSFSVLKDNANENGVLVSFNNENVWSSVGSTVGDVKQSVLTEEQFLSLNGNAWALMDGRDVTGSVYHAITGNIVIPDMVTQGAFLRQATDGRALGSYEADALQGHHHLMQDDLNGGGQMTFSHAPGYRSYATPTHTMLSVRATTLLDDGVNGTPRVANETRSKNVAINFFIKIN
jgi:hypothetical protein